MKGIEGNRPYSRYLKGSNLPIRVISVDFVHPFKSRNDFSLAKCIIRVSASLTSLLLAVRTFTVAPASKKKITMISSTHNLPLSSLKIFLLSRMNKLDREFLHWQNLTWETT